MSNRIELPAQLTIRESAAFKEALTALLGNHPLLVLDAQRLTLIDTAGLQLLAVFLNEARDRAVEVVWENQDEALYRAADLLGLRARIGLGEEQVRL